MSEKIIIELDQDDYAALDYALSSIVCNERTEKWLLEPQSKFHFSSDYYNNEIGPQDFILMPMTYQEAKAWQLSQED